VRRVPGRVEVWRDLPLWFLWVAPFALLDLDLNHLSGRLWPALVAFAIPFGLITWVFARAPHRRRWWLAYGLGSGALLAMAIGGWTGPRLDTVIMLRIFEVAALVEFAVLAAHAWWVAGRRTFWLIFGVGLIYGLILENAGVALGFFAEEGYLLYFPGLPAPMATGLGWCVVFYPLWWAAPRLVGEGAGHARKAMAATGLALALDLQLDPLATALGLWEWHPTLEPAIRGVPMVNFSAWLAAVLPFSWAVFRAEELPGSPARRVGRSLPWILAAALCLVLLFIAVTEIGEGWPSLRRFADAARAGLVG